MQLNSNHKNLLCLLAITLVWFVFSWPWLVDGKVIPHDAKNHFYPMIRFVAHSWHSGESFLWSPHHFGGFPMVSDPQSAIWTISLWVPVLLSAKPSIALVDTVHLLHLLVGAFAIFAFGRGNGWGYSTSILASLTYMLAGAPTFRLEHFLMTVSYMWLAIALWRLDFLIRNGGILHGILFGVALAFLLIDRNHVAYLGAFFLFFYWLATLVNQLNAGGKIQTLIKSHLPVALGGVIALVIVVVPVILLLQLAQNSNRPEFGLVQASWQSLHPASLLTFFLPEYFGALDGSVRHWGPASRIWGGENLTMHRGMLHLYSGILPVILILWIGITKRQLFVPGIRFFTIASAFYLIYSLGRYTPLFGILYDWIPGVDLFRRPSDGLFLFGFSIALLTGALLEKIHTTVNSRQQIWLPLSCLLAVISAAFIIANTYGRLSDFANSLFLPILLGIGIVLTLLYAKQKPLLLGFAITFTGFDLVYHSTNNRMNTRPVDAYVVLEKPKENPMASKIMQLLPDAKNPNELWRTEIIGLGPVVQNLPQVINSQSILGYNPLRIQAIEKYIAPDMQNNASKRRNFGMKMTGYDSELTNKLGLRYIISGAPLETIDNQIAKGRFELLEKINYGKRTAHIYENKAALPRAALLSDTSSGPSGKFEIIQYSNTKIEISINAKQKGKLVLRDFYYPGWVATLNDEETIIIRHNRIFRAVNVPEGKTKLVLEFDPLSIKNLWQAASTLGQDRR